MFRKFIKLRITYITANIYIVEQTTILQIKIYLLKKICSHNYLFININCNFSIQLNIQCSMYIIISASPLRVGKLQWSK